MIQSHNEEDAGIDSTNFKNILYNNTDIDSNPFSEPSNRGAPSASETGIGMRNSTDDYVFPWKPDKIKSSEIAETNDVNNISNADTLIDDFSLESDIPELSSEPEIGSDVTETEPPPDDPPSPIEKSLTSLSDKLTNKFVVRCIAIGFIILLLLVFASNLKSFESASSPENEISEKVGDRSSATYESQRCPLVGVSSNGELNEFSDVGVGILSNIKKFIEVRQNNVLFYIEGVISTDNAPVKLYISNEDYSRLTEDDIVKVEYQKVEVNDLFYYTNVILLDVIK